MENLKVVSQLFGLVKQIEITGVSSDEQNIAIQIQFLELDGKFYPR